MPEQLPKEGEPQLVAGPDCVRGQVDQDALYASAGLKFIPIHPIGGGDQVIGYWLNQWYTVAQYQAADRDPARAVAMVPQVAQPGPGASK